MPSLGEEAGDTRQVAGGCEITSRVLMMALLSIPVFLQNLTIGSDGNSINRMCVGVHACVLSCFSHAGLFVIPWTIARQAPLSMEFSRQEY